MSKRLLVLLSVLLLGVGPLLAVTRLQRLSDDRYLITLQKLTGLGNEGRVLRQLHVKAASLCVLKGFMWFEVKNQTSHGRSAFKTAQGTFEVKLHQERPNDDAYDCASLATDEEKEKLTKELAKPVD